MRLGELCLGHSLDLDAQGLTHGVREAVDLARVQPDVDRVHAHILGVDLKQENQLLQLPRSRGRELKQDNLIMMWNNLIANITPAMSRTF